MCFIGASGVVFMRTGQTNGLSDTKTERAILKDSAPSFSKYVSMRLFSRLLFTSGCESDVSKVFDVNKYRSTSFFKLKSRQLTFPLCGRTDGVLQ